MSDRLVNKLFYITLAIMIKLKPSSPWYDIMRPNPAEQTSRLSLCVYGPNTRSSHRRLLR